MNWWDISSSEIGRLFWGEALENMNGFLLDFEALARNCTVASAEMRMISLRKMSFNHYSRSREARQRQGSQRRAGDEQQSERHRSSDRESQEVSASTSNLPLLPHSQPRVERGAN